MDDYSDIFLQEYDDNCCKSNLPIYCNKLSDFIDSAPSFITCLLCRKILIHDGDPYYFELSRNKCTFWNIVVDSAQYFIYRLITIILSLLIIGCPIILIYLIIIIDGSSTFYAVISMVLLLYIIFIGFLVTAWYKSKFTDIYF